MNRPAPWFVNVTSATLDADYFAAAPAAFILRLRPIHAGDPSRATGVWCPEGMQLVALVTRAGHKTLYWIDARVSFADVWTDDAIRELIFEDPQHWNALRRRPGFSASRVPKPCPAV